MVETYTGRWVEGRQQGKGRYENSLGTLYDGEFKDGLPDGKGVYHWPDGTRYSGGWKAGQRVGLPFCALVSRGGDGVSCLLACG